MAGLAIRNEERLGLAVAIAAHGALVALLIWRPPAPAPLPVPDRIAVTISDEIAPLATAPQPQAEPASDVAPEAGEPAPPAPPVEKAAPRPEPPQPAPQSVVVPRPPPKPQPRPVAKPVPAPRPVARPVPVPRPVARPAPAARAVARPAPARPAAAPPRAANTSARPSARAGASRIGEDFLKGVSGAQGSTRSSAPPAAAIGPAVQTSLLGALSRALRPHWQGKVPDGPDAEKLVTVLRWNLNRDGSLAGAPQVVRQEGITDANRPQAARHAEQAIRAVQLAAPFTLPDEYYDAWKRVTIKFDKRLSQ